MAWPPDRDPAQQIVSGRRFSYPRENTLTKVANCLVNLFGWLEKRKYDWQTIEYDPDLLEYAEDMQSGFWSRDKSALSPSTVNSRMDYASDFLVWASARDLRAPFIVPMGISRHRFATGTSMRPSTKHSKVRAGRVRLDPIDLRLPEIAELRSWILEVERRKGYTKALSCRTILGSGIRREEAAMLPLDFIPLRRSEWNVGKDNRVRFKVTEGTKGGKKRIVTIPLQLAEELHTYRTTKRVRAQADWIKSHRGEPKPDRLFLGSYDGTPLSAATIYDAWTSASLFLGWSPHLGRHTWACYELLDALRQEAITARLAPGSVPIGWLESTTKTLIGIVVQPNLGHIDEETTRTYVQWLRFQLALPAAYSAWQDFLESTDREDG